MDTAVLHEFLSSPPTVAYVAAGVVALSTLYYLFGGGLGYKPRACFSTIAEPPTKNSSGIYQNWRVPKGKPLFSRHDPNVGTLYEAWEASVASFKDLKCMGTRKFIRNHSEEKTVRGVKKTWTYPEMGSYSYQTYGEVAKRINNVGSGLMTLGLKQKQNVAIFLETRAEWRIAAQACFSQNLIIMTVYANLGDEALIHGLNESEARVMVTSGDLTENLAKLIKKLPHLKTIIHCDPEKAKAESLKTLEAAGVKIITFEELEKSGESNPVDHNPPKPSDIAVLMYTSGSTGMPKGVMSTHANTIASIAGALAGIQPIKGDVHLSYLPLAHILAFTVESGVLTVGGTLAYGNPRTLTDTLVRNCKGDITEACPNFLVGVPGIYDRIRSALQHKIKAGSAISQAIFKFAYSTRKAALEQGKDTPIFNALIFNKMSAAIGGRVRFMVSGGAPLSKECAEFMRVCFGVPILQGYGLTETTAAVSIGELEDPMAYTASGPPFCSVQFKLVDVPDMGYSHTDKEGPRGEIWIRGPGVCLGYFKNAEKTAEDFVDGWFKSGDIGRVNQNGTLSIIDRKKNLVKPPHGEYIAVERLESSYKNCPLVSNIMVYASESHNELIALVQPNKAALEEWAKKKGIDEHWEELCKDEKAEKAVVEALNQTWKETNLKSIERISAVLLFAEEWSPDNGYLTAAQKVARPAIVEKHKEDIKELYKKLE